MDHWSSERSSLVHILLISSSDYIKKQAGELENILTQYESIANLS